MRDFLGNTISIGDRVVYATTAARSPVLKAGTVERLEAHDEIRYRWFEGVRSEYPLTVWKIGIRYSDSSSGWSRNVGKQLSWPNPDNVVYISPA